MMSSSELKIFLGCSHVDIIIGSSILGFLPGFLSLEVHCFGFIGHISVDKEKGQMDIAEDSVEHCVWVMGGWGHFLQCQYWNPQG